MRCAGHNLDAQRLVFAGKNVQDGWRTLAEYGVVNKSSIHLTLRES